MDGHLLPTSRWTWPAGAGEAPLHLRPAPTSLPGHPALVSARPRRSEWPFCLRQPNPLVKLGQSFPQLTATVPGGTAAARTHHAAQSLFFQKTHRRLWKGPWRCESNPSQEVTSEGWLVEPTGAASRAADNPGSSHSQCPSLRSPVADDVRRNVRFLDQPHTWH